MRGARRDIGFFARVSRVALATAGKQGSNTVNTANTAAIWHTTLDRLETAPMDAVCKAWLQSANLTSAPHLEKMIWMQPHCRDRRRRFISHCRYQVRWRAM